MKILIGIFAVLIMGSGLVLMFRHQAEAPVHHDVSDIETIIISH